MSEFRNQLKVEGVNARGYGIMPKMVVLDRKLSIEAKAIYAYFCSYAGAGTTAFPSVSKIISDLGIGKSRYYNHFNQLVDLGYIKVEQSRHEKGKFKHNIYTLQTNPNPVDKSEEEKEESPCTQNKDTVKNVEISTTYPCTRFRDTDSQDTDDRTTNSNNLLDNQQSLYKYHSFIHEEEGKTERKFNDKVHKTMIEKKAKHILDQSQYEYIDKDYQKSIEYSVRSLLLIKDIEINGIKTPGSIIQKEIESLNITHLDRAIEKYEEAAKTTNIKNKNKYFMYCLYDSLFDADISIRTDMVRDNL